MKACELYMQAKENSTADLEGALTLELIAQSHKRKAKILKMRLEHGGSVKIRDQIKEMIEKKKQSTVDSEQTSKKDSKRQEIAEKLQTQISLAKYKELIAAQAKLEDAYFL